MTTILLIILALLAIVFFDRIIAAVAILLLGAYLAAVGTFLALVGLVRLVVKGYELVRDRAVFLWALLAYKVRGIRS